MDKSELIKVFKLLSAMLQELPDEDYWKFARRANVEQDLLPKLRNVYVALKKAREVRQK